MDKCENLSFNNILETILLSKVPENGILLHDQLFFQVSRALGHRLPCLQEKATPWVPPSLNLIIHIPQQLWQLFYMFSTTLLRLCSAIANSMARLVWCVSSCRIDISTRVNIFCPKSWVVITLNLTVHVLMCKHLKIPKCSIFSWSTDSTADYYYYATAGGAKIWVRLHRSHSSCYCLTLWCSGRSTWRWCKLSNSSSTSLWSTSEVRLLIMLRVNLYSFCLSQHTSTTPLHTTMVSFPILATALEQKLLLFSVVDSSPATWVFSSTSTFRRTRNLSQARSLRLMATE